MGVFRTVTRPFVRVFAAYEAAVARRPLGTQIAAGTVLVTIGDGLAQHAVEKTPRHDWRRTGIMIAMRGVLHSWLIVSWLRLLHERLPLPQLSQYGRVAVHLTLDQSFFGPANIGLFFAGSGVLEGKSVDEIKAKIRDRWWSSVKLGWGVWVPFSFCMYSFVPMTYRLVSGQLVGIGWNCYMSYANAHAQRQRAEAKDQLTAT
ncbi:Protein required for ethanol metabolism [Savitreella phatthalungensis]